jgi:pilus assembly protein CpaF
MRPDLDDLRLRVHDEILRTTAGNAEIDHRAISDVVTRLAPLLDPVAHQQLLSAVLADVHGLGPLQALLEDPLVTDVMVVGERGVWIERSGKVEQTPLRLTSEEIAHLAERIVAPLGLRVDRASPMVDARLPDGSRVNVIVPPLAIDGPCLTIRRFAAKPIPLLAFAGAEWVRLLQKAVTQRRNVLISGGTGAGKTTLLNAMTQVIDPSERVITIEDAAELRLPAEHVVRLEARPANAEGVGQTTLRELLRNALRMRPDRIVLGEVRGPEALDMLQAMNTGHEGSLSTCHANSPLDALTRIETMVLMAGVDLPLPAIRQQILASIDLVVQVRRLPDGVRKITAIAEVQSRGEQLAVVNLVDEAGAVRPFTRPSRYLQGVAS